MAEIDNNVGILGMEVYFPSTYVTQKDLEVANNVSAGKYTIGLGQETMAFTGDQEDINSIALTVVQSLLEKYSINPNEIGRLEIGTETLIDKSKSTKTVLMSLFAESGNTDIEGATVVNACYGGTAALMNALLWVDSSAWDGRYAIVVAGDIAVYSDGPARPTGGCGAVALLVGRDAPLKFDLRTRVTHACHVWDFFKPKMESEYPEVNGALSQTCYLRAVDDCYLRFTQKCREIRNKDTTLSSADYYLFHSPYNKLVQKSCGRLVYHDMLNNVIDGTPVQKWKDIPINQTYEDKELETALKNISATVYKQKVNEGCIASKLVGNTYTASVWLNLAYLVSSVGGNLLDKTVVLFSYGSGALASMLNIIPRVPTNTSTMFTLEKMQSELNFVQRLNTREKLTPEDLTAALQAREDSHGVVPFKPKFNAEKLYPGTFYLDEINASHERLYTRKPVSESRVLGGTSIKNSTTTTTSTDDVGLSLDDDTTQENTQGTTSDKIVTKRANLSRNETYVWPSGRPNLSVVVTGIAAALPSMSSDDVDTNAPNVDNIRRIINGENFISNIPPKLLDEMIDKNVFELVKSSQGKGQEKKFIARHEEMINVRACLGKFSLTAYGVSESIVSTMDRSVQIAIAAGLEALKDANIVTGEGEGTSGYVLPEHMQNTTGVVYATSFPALDAAIEEVTKYFKTKTVDNMQVEHVLDSLKDRLQQKYGTFNTQTAEAFEQLEKLTAELTKNDLSVEAESKYEYDRKFLFRVLVLGNAQLAQIIKARGPNMQTNAACAGATQAIALAYDMIQVGRAERVVVIAGDSASSDILMPWLGNGFRSLGAACIASDVKMAAMPFNPQRSGMILGSGAIGIVLESEQGALRRFYNSPETTAVSKVAIRRPYRCRLLATLVSNSAYHGAAMDRDHIATEMERFMKYIETEHNISRKELARHGVYFSHETSTHASPTSSCAANEVYALRKVFGEELKNLLILNTKGFTGHPMGVSFEDVVAAEVLVSNRVPPIANFTTGDPALGSDLKYSKGGEYPCKYAMRFAAGFGSQIALALYGNSD